MLGKVLTFFVVLLIHCSSLSAQDDFRKWKDKTGKFEVSAKLVSKTDTTVTLEKKDGSKIDVPIERLSEADQDFLNGDQKDKYEVKGIIETNAKGAKRLTLNGTVIWNVELDPMQEAGEGPDTYDLPNTRIYPAFTQDRKMFYCSGAGKGSPDLKLINFSTGKVVWTGKTQAKMAKWRSPTAVSPDPQLVVYSNGSDLFFANLRKSGLIKGLLQWRPYKPSTENPKLGITFTSFVGPDHILTASSRLGVLVLWSWRDAKAVWRADFSPTTNPIFTHNKKYLMVHSKEQLCFLNPLSGEVVGRIDCPFRGLEKFAFSPTGKQLAVAGSKMIRIFNMTTGKKSQEIGVFESGYKYRGIPGSRALTWVNDEVIHHFRFFEVESGMPFAMEIKPDVHLTQMIGPDEFFQFNQNESHLGISRQKIKDWSEERAEIGKVEYVMQPGDTISVELQTQGIPEQRKQEIYDDILRQLKSNQILVNQASPKRLVILMSSGGAGGSKLRWGMGGAGLNENVSRTAYFGKRTVTIKNSGLYLGKHFYPIVSLDHSIIEKLRIMSDLKQDRGEWVPDVVIPARVPSDARLNHINPTKPIF